MSEIRIIKKYPNRRLYDTVESRYITLDDVRRLVMERVEFSVIDKRSQQDITRPVLLQVIAELEQRNGTVLSQDFLARADSQPRPRRARRGAVELPGAEPAPVPEPEAAGRGSGRGRQPAGASELSALAQRAGRDLPHPDEEPPAPG